MSLSNPNKSQNPAQKFIEFKGGAGVFSYYDKEKQENIPLPLHGGKFYIIVLDQLNTVKGYHEASNSGIVAREVRRHEDDMVVRSFKGGEIARGKWADIKDRVKAAGGKYAKSVYAMLITPKTKDVPESYELVNFQIYGAALGSWFDIRADDDGQVISFEGTEKKKKGSTVFYVPIFKKHGRRDDIFVNAVDMDKDLQSYLGDYFNMESEIEIVPKEADETFKTDKDFLQDSDDLPF